MNKLLWGFLSLFLSLFLEAKPLFMEYKTSLLQSSETMGTIADSPEVVVGGSGVIIHRFDAKTATIISRVDVVSKSEGKAQVKFEKFQMLSQGAFPDTGVKPSVGDEVIINYLYDRALIIAPNQATYTSIIKKYPDITWIHPDLVAGYLTKLYRPNPDKTIFQAACYQNSASLIVFAIGAKAHFVDCTNFNTLTSIDITPTNGTEVPFYSRIKNIETSWFNWGSANIPDYNSYYSTLIRK